MPVVVMWSDVFVTKIHPSNTLSNNSHNDPQSKHTFSIMKKGELMTF